MNNFMTCSINSYVKFKVALIEGNKEWLGLDPSFPGHFLDGSWSLLNAVIYVTVNT